MKIKAMADDKIIEIKNFKKVNGQIVNTKGKRKKKEPKEFPDNDMLGYDELEEELMQLMEENEELQMQLLEEKIRTKTLEKLLNKILKQMQKGKDSE